MLGSSATLRAPAHSTTGITMQSDDEDVHSQQDRLQVYKQVVSSYTGTRGCRGALHRGGSRAELTPIPFANCQSISCYTPMETMRTRKRIRRPC